MDDQNRSSYPGEEHNYSQPPYSPKEKIRPPQFWLPSQRLFTVITTTLLVIVVILGAVIVHLLTPSSQNSHQLLVLATPTMVTTPLQTGTAVTPTTNTSTPTPTTNALTSTPTSTSCTRSCTGYQENGAVGCKAGL